MAESPLAARTVVVTARVATRPLSRNTLPLTEPRVQERRTPAADVAPLNRDASGTTKSDVAPSVRPSRRGLGAGRSTPATVDAVRTAM